MNSFDFQTRPLSSERPHRWQEAKKSVFGPIKRNSSWRRRCMGILGVFQAAGERSARFARGMMRQRPRSMSGWSRLVFQVGGACSAFLVLYIALLWFTLPDISDPRSLLASQSTVITDRNGTELYRLFSEEDRTYIPGEAITLHVQQAIIAIEDERFFERGCIDVRAIFRAMLANLFDFKSQGGSTITQQLVRNALLTREKRISRKLKELMLSCQLESAQSKQDLLELYLNWIPFGQNAYGIEQASQVYFSTSASGLTLAQSAVLAALPQRPSYFSPYRRHRHTSVSEEIVTKIQTGEITKASQIPDEEISIGLLGAYIGTGSTVLYIGGRTDQVLRNMQDQGFITEQERLSALKELETIVFLPSRESIRAPHFVLWVREQVEEMFAETAEEGLLEQGGLVIETTLDWGLQEAAEGVVAFHREDLTTRYGGENMALVALDPETKEILAYVGNMDYADEENEGKIDMVRAPRQPGSSFKPFLYAAAFQNGYGPATVLWDVPTKIGDDKPQNFDGKFRGLMTIRQALGASRNIPAVKTFFLAGGEEPILALTEALGAPTPLQRRAELAQEREDGFEYGWPLALGAAETPLLEMVHAYSTLASAGEFKPVVAIRRITDKNGNLLFQTDFDEPGKPVLDPRIAFQLTSILSDTSARPEEYWRTQLTVPGFQTAAKTGTSNKCLEWKKNGTCRLRKPDNAWLIGYTPMLAAGVWVGNANSASMYDKAGGLNTASPIWRDFMIRAHRLMGIKKTSFSAPEGIVQPQISTLSGQLPTECTPVEFRKADIFLRENAPTLPDPACAQLTIDKLTKLLASDECPEDAQEEGSFIVAKSILPKRWPFWEQGVQDWVAEQMELWYATENHSGAIISLPIAPTEECDPDLTPGRLIRPELSIRYPSQGGSANYPSFKPQLDYDVGSSVREVVYKLDGKKIKKVTESPFDAAIRIPRSIKKSGTHKLKVILTDEYFNTVSAEVSFTFTEDKDKPTVQLTLPRGDITLPKGGELTMRAKAHDAEGGIKYVQFYIDDQLLSTKPKEPFEMTYTLDLDPGVYSIRAVASDFAKNTAEDEVTLTVVGE